MLPGCGKSDFEAVSPQLCKTEMVPALLDQLPLISCSSDTRFSPDSGGENIHMHEKYEYIFYVVYMIIDVIQPFFLETTGLVGLVLPAGCVSSASRYDVYGCCFKKSDSLWSM